MDGDAVSLFLSCQALYSLSMSFKLKSPFLKASAYSKSSSSLADPMLPGDIVPLPRLKVLNGSLWNTDRTKYIHESFH